MPTVLVVDDNSNVTRALSRLLRHDGFEPLAAGSISEALAIMDEEHIDAMLVDVRLPDGEGTMLANALVHRHPRAVVLAMTAFPEDVDVLPATVTRLLIKPFPYREIASAISHLLREPVRALAFA